MATSCIRSGPGAGFSAALKSVHWTVNPKTENRNQKKARSPKSERGLIGGLPDCGRGG